LSAALRALSGVSATRTRTRPSLRPTSISVPGSSVRSISTVAIGRITWRRISRLMPRPP
jgi:hypothetical protein